MKVIFCILLLFIFKHSCYSQISQSIEEYSITGDSRVKADDYEVAMKEYDEALKNDSTDYLLYDKKGYALMKLNKPNEAIRNFGMAMKLKDDDTLAYYFTGKLLLKTKDDDNALWCFKKVTKFDNTNDEAYFDCGYIIFRHQGDLQYGEMGDAINYFSIAILLDNTQAKYFHYRGKAFYFYYYFFNDYNSNSYNKEMAKKYANKAVTDFKKAIELDNSLENDLNIFIQNVNNDTR